MPDYIIQPFIGVGPVRLGMSRTEVLQAMRESSEPFRKTKDSRYETDAFHQSGFQVSYGGEQPTVEFIELSRESGFRAFYRELEVFATSAAEVVVFISRDAAFDDADPELPYTYQFRGLQLSLWRPVIPESEADTEGRCFSTIGIGRRGYFD